MAKILIFGGCGFVGSNLALHFVKKNNTVIVFDNLVRRGSEYNMKLLRQNGVQFIHGDIRNKEDFSSIPNWVDIILECSAQPSAVDGYKNPYFDFSNNTLGLFNVLEYTRKNKCSLIFWATNKCYSGDKINNIQGIKYIEKETRYDWYVNNDYIVDPAGFKPYHGFTSDFTIDGGQHSIYGMSKAMSDLACQEYANAFDLNIVTNRFSCLAGPMQWGKCAQGWVAWWAIAAKYNLPVVYIGWKGKQVRDVLFADDICNLIDLEINNIEKIKGRVFNIGGGMDNTLSLIEATNLMEKKFNVKMNTEYIPEPRKADHIIYITDNRPVTNAIGWKPKIGIEEGYDQIIEWVNNNDNILKELYNIK